MFRELIASVALLVGSACAIAPQAAAAADQVVQVAQFRCLLSADYLGRGRPMAICGLADGSPFGPSPMSTGKYPVKLNLAVMRSTGEMWWEAGPVPGSPGQAAVGMGQSYTANGWTVSSDEHRTVIKNDYTGHGMILNPADVRQL